MNLTATDRTLVRDLAKQVAEVAALAIQAERRELWKRHNRLERIRPMILVFPEGSWAELLPDAVLQCETDAGRGLERALRTRLYYHDHLSDDTVIEDEWVVHKAVHVTGWGLQAKHIPSTLPRGAWAFDPVIDKPADLKQLTFPEVSHDEAATQRNLETAQELFGDILTVKLKGVCHVSFHPMALYTRLRGLEQVMVDMVAEPTWLHEAMAFLEAGYRRQVQQYVDQNLLDLNNDSTYHSSGGNGYSTELPKSDCDPDRIRPADMWASAEAQELAQVSPDMHYEFSLQYESRLLEPFGLNGYGCCEDLTRKLDHVFTIPHIRRISIAPHADVAVCAEKLRGNYVFSWKPQPSHLVGDFNEDLLRRYLGHAMEVTKGCVFEMILKDTHTCQHRPERFTRWTEIARELVEGC